LSGINRRRRTGWLALAIIATAAKQMRKRVAHLQKLTLCHPKVKEKEATALDKRSLGSVEQIVTSNNNFSNQDIMKYTEG